MKRHRISTVLSVFAGLVLASGSAFASAAAAGLGSPLPQRSIQRDMSAPRMQAAGQRAMAARLGATVGPDSDNNGFTAKYTRYVGCANSPAAETFATLEKAFIGNTQIKSIQPYTVVKVCAGVYPGANVLNTPYVAIVGQGASGLAAITCANHATEGLDLQGSYDRVYNMTFNGCYVGVGINYPDAPGEVQQDAVQDSYFNYNDYGVYSQDCSWCAVKDNVLQHTYKGGVGNDFDAHDVFAGNVVVGSGEATLSFGIYDYASVDTRIYYNQVGASEYGIYAYESEFAQIEHNGSIGNLYSGLYMDRNTSGAEVEYNRLYDNGLFGIYASEGTGANASGKLPNQFLYNRAYDNGGKSGGADYEDASYRAGSHRSHTNDGTANYWHGNEGKSAHPSSILTS